VSQAYGITLPDFWDGPTGRAIGAAGGKDAQLLALYLTANREATMIGLYPIELSIVRARMQTLTPKAIEKALDVLAAVGFADFDRASSHVWVREMAKFRLALHVKPLDVKDNRIKHAHKLYRECRTNPFLGPFFDRYAADLHMAERRGEAAPEGASEPLRRGSGAPSKPVTETETDSVTEPQDQDPRASRAERSVETVENHKPPQPRNDLGVVRIHLMRACHDFFESDDPQFTIQSGPRRGQPDESAIRDAMKDLAARHLNAKWDYSTEIAAIYSAVEKTRESRGQLKARLA
jgi:hypothetical protein